MKTQLASSVIVLCLLMLGGTAHADGKKLVVVVAKGSGLTNISRTELKRCFLGESVSGGGKTLVPFNATANTPDRVGFDKAVLGMTPDEVGRFWVDRKVRGQSAAPRSLPSPAHMAKVAAKFPGAIGYLAEDQLTSDIQAVEVDGIPYSDPRYNIVSQWLMTPTRTDTARVTAGRTDRRTSPAAGDDSERPRPWSHSRI
jgi:hypothetical protein